MASKRGSSSGQDSVDVAYVLQAFQEINRCIIEIRMGVSALGKSTTLEMELLAHDKDKGIGEAAPLASVKLSLGYHNPQRMEAAILQALYRLDADMGHVEFARELKE